ncbi:MAG: hypothetical protein HZB19_17255 [Chloroflexi bacterium]|nr:hypothetical protein [Chloroflexota bacterium]
MNSSVLIAIITAIAALVGAVSPIIVALIQSNKDKQPQTGGIILPSNVILHQPKIRVRWSVILIFSFVFGVLGYGMALLANPGASTSQSITPESTSFPPTLEQAPMPTPWFLGNGITSTDPKPLCTIAVNNNARESGRDNAMGLTFNITGQDGFCSWIISLDGYDASSKKQVTFLVKGEKGGEQYLVGIKDVKTESGREPKVPETASASWAQVSIPLDDFENQDLSSLENFSLSFKIGSGTIYVDELIFTP